MTATENSKTPFFFCLLHTLDNISSGELSIYSWQELVFIALWISASQCQSVTDESRLSLSIHVFSPFKLNHLQWPKINRYATDTLQLLCNLQVPLKPYPKLEGLQLLRGIHSLNLAFIQLKKMPLIGRNNSEVCWHYNLYVILMSSEVTLNFF